MAMTFDAILRIVAKASGQTDIAKMTASIRQLDDQATKFEGTASGLSRNLKLIGAGLGAAAAFTGFAELTRQIGGAAIEAERSDRRIRALTSGLGELRQVQAIASKAASEFAMSNIDAQNAVADLYGRLRPMGATVKEIETVFFGVNKAARLFGLTAFDVNEVMRQLGQAMGSGRLQGDELRSLMERMPALGQALATTMGVSVGEIKKLGSEGKITTDVIIKAAGELNRLQPPPPTSFLRFQKAAQDVATSLGIALLPIVDRAANFFARLGETIVSVAISQRENIRGFIDTAVSAVKALMPVVELLAKTYVGFKLLTSVIAAATLATKAYALISSLTPQGLIVMAASAAVGIVAFRRIKGIMDDIVAKSKTASTDTVDWDKAMRGLGFTASGLKGTLEGLPPPIASAEAAAEALRKEEEGRAYWLERAGSAYEKQAAQIDLISAAQQRRTALASEENTLAQAYNNLGKTILQNRLELAKTDEEKLAIGRQIAQMEAESARLQLEATKLQIQAEEELKAAALNRAISNRKAIESTMALAAAMFNAGQLGMEKILNYRLELDKAKATADAAQLEFNQARQIGGIRRNIANVNYQSSVLQATGATDPGFNQAPRSYTTIAGIRIPQYARGGYVTKPTLALIGEGGEPEYVVPRSKVRSFANNIASGAKGEQALRPSWREVALETLANNPTDYMRAANAIMTGWRNQGGIQRASNEPMLKREALRSLGFGIGGSREGGGGFTINRVPSLASIRGELESLRAGRSGSRSSVGITLNTRVDKVVRQDGEDKVTFAQAQALASDAARQAVAQMDRNLKSPTYRQQVGIR